MMEVVGTFHRYFDEGTPEEIVADCAGFLDDLFHDRIVVYRAQKGTRVLNAGSCSSDAPASVEYLRRLSQEADNLRAGTWSGPWEDDGIVAHG
jgi:hypothetical protein